MSKYEHHFSHDEHHCVQLVPLFALLSESELAQVEQVVHHKTFEKGEAVISPFTVPQLAIVAHGTLKIYQLSSAGKEQLLRVIEPGGYAGEDALFGVVNENLYGETLQETKICFLRQQDFKNLLLKYPELSLKLLETTVRRAAEMQYQAQFLMMEDVESRIANYLLQLVKVVDSNSVMIPMKMKDLATFIGTTPETISRKFKIFEEKGFIERRGKIIKILDIDSLEDDYA